MDKVDLKKKPPRFFFLHFFAIHSSSRHEKRCRMLKRIFACFNALETYGDPSLPQIEMIDIDHKSLPIII